jgi:hypothetical protein
MVMTTWIRGKIGTYSLLRSRSCGQEYSIGGDVKYWAEVNHVAGPSDRTRLEPPTFALAGLMLMHFALLAIASGPFSASQKGSGGL